LYILQYRYNLAVLLEDHTAQIEQEQNRVNVNAISSSSSSSSVSGGARNNEKRAGKL